MTSSKSLNKFNYLDTLEIANIYELNYDFLITFLENEKLVYIYNNVLRITQKAIKLGATYNITSSKKNVIWPINSLNKLIENKISYNKKKNLEIINDYGIEYIYHMTHIDNLPSILKNGLYPHANSLQKIDISDCDVNSRRSRIENVFLKSIHSYVPFYFNPKNAMLYVRRNIQNNIVILKLKKELLTQSNTLFTDGNASCIDTKFFNNLEDLNKLNWHCINDNNWSNYEDGKRVKMSEILVPGFVSVDNIEGIICNNTLVKLDVEKMQSNIEVSIDTKRKFYF